MTDIHWENIKDNLCVMCKATLKSSSYYLCDKCNKVCQITHTKISEDISDLKSVCCNSDVQFNNTITCSNFCHNQYILKKIEEDGLFTKVIDSVSGIAYKVPTKLIIEEGLRQEDLKNYPTW